MFSIARHGAAASMMAVAAALSSPAFAATTAGSTITNTVSVTYRVGGVTQPSLSASDTFRVDRKVNLTVVEEGSATTQVSPGQTAAVTSFLISNLSNDSIDIALAASNLGSDNYDVSNFSYYADTDDDGVYTAGTDVEITYLDQIAAETSNIRVFVLADVPLGGTTGQVANIRLTGTAAEATAAGSLGAVITQTTGANVKMTMDTVFADSNANGNVAGDGIDFAQDSYTIFTAALTALKSSKIISDPVNLTTNPKMIPGATVEYCITVRSASGGAAATAVAISDTLDANTTFEPTFGVLVNGTVTGPDCNADGADTGAHAAGVVSGTIPSIAAGDARTVLFRVTIN